MYKQFNQEWDLAEKVREWTEANVQWGRVARPERELTFNQWKEKIAECKTEMNEQIKLIREKFNSKIANLTKKMNLKQKISDLKAEFDEKKIDPKNYGYLDVLEDHIFDNNSNSKDGCSDPEEELDIIKIKPVENVDEKPPNTTTHTTHNMKVYYHGDEDKIDNYDPNSAGIRNEGTYSNSGFISSLNSPSTNNNSSDISGNINYNHDNLTITNTNSNSNSNNSHNTNSNSNNNYKNK